MSQTAMQLLEKALAVLERDGWTSGRYIHEDGRKCALGALGAALSPQNYRYGINILTCTPEWVPGAKEALRRLADEADPYQAPQYRALTEPVGRIIAWNDREGRSYEDVVLAFKKAIEGNGNEDEA